MRKLTQQEQEQVVGGNEVHLRRIIRDKYSCWKPDHVEKVVTWVKDYCKTYSNLMKASNLETKDVIRQNLKDKRNKYAGYIFKGRIPAINQQNFDELVEEFDKIGRGGLH